VFSHFQRKFADLPLNYSPTRMPEHPERRASARRRVDGVRIGRAPFAVNHPFYPSDDRADLFTG
ncbi:MAG: hypothetical protein J0H21_16000, partial [Rhizobiales bacterium]|nr:hypothetical protein [Hyphomicrobiales bacterium]